MGSTALDHPLNSKTHTRMSIEPVFWDSEQFKMIDLSVDSRMEKEFYIYTMDCICVSAWINLTNIILRKKNSGRKYAIWSSICKCSASAKQYCNYPKIHTYTLKSIKTSMAMKATKLRPRITSWKDESEQVRKRSTIMGSWGKQNGFRLFLYVCFIS